MEFTWGERFFHIFDFQRALLYKEPISSTWFFTIFAETKYNRLSGGQGDTEFGRNSFSYLSPFLTLHKTKSVQHKVAT